VVITSGVILLVGVGAAFIAGIGFLHYLFWGRTLSEATADEREEMRLREWAEAEEWDLPTGRHPRRP
jgi:hypothetical protein